ncbi:hypothetical protein TVAG_492540 [Trichomonas vaginalis G3]|uniref:AIG1-type G domain-containing protein n=1 Tax=Trichomonas vaginalis (strain ATCC PRA-98 / G3) TaxID=412133 RepID=A2F8H0_TRIV3|nr:hypothetical protein TVAGG3_0903580 [Trichomonas vaginalis G3]EAX98763.1 hypothetical protein TVAG_492540 [Trichomonas vaginalis G3]KAI5483883.1 hypothetical protein TVAGG3_0903580 [Trichomonas vaginalis G3]|eukprot:XP_001311693.1 hypothetical protein [Trichomonas vaginalis G3]
MLDHLTIITALYLIGEAGSGCTMFGNLLSNAPVFPKSTDHINETIKNAKSWIKFGDLSIVVYDSTGYNESYSNAKFHIEKISESIESEYVGVSAIGLVIPLHTERLSNIYKEYLNAFYEIFETDEIFYNIAIIFTHCPFTDYDRFGKTDIFKNSVENYITEITGKRRWHNIKTFFVDNMEPDRPDVQFQLSQFKDWTRNRLTFIPKGSFQNKTAIGRWSIIDEYRKEGEDFSEKFYAPVIKYSDKYMRSAFRWEPAYGNDSIYFPFTYHDYSREFKNFIREYDQDPLLFIGGKENAMFIFGETENFRPISLVKNIRFRQWIYTKKYENAEKIFFKKLQREGKI